MSDMQRTLTYVAVAGLAAIVAWEPWRAAKGVSSQPEETLLIAEFKDPSKAKSLEIVKYDEETSALHPFKVAQIDNVWSIPSHHNYPADAHEHMAKAATTLIDLTSLGLVSESRGDQELYGVVEPDPKTLRVGALGVGMRVTLRDVKQDALADLIIGKAVKDQPDQRYVRKVGSDRIYRVALKTDSLSTKFEDWIEKDLLKLNALDVRDVELNDYSTEAGMTREGGIAVAKTPRSRLKLAYQDDKSKWTLKEFAEYDKKGKQIADSLKEDEELNTDKLNTLKTALSDLKIVDVERKPKGLSTDLRASQDFVKDQEALTSLVRSGFYPVQTSDDRIEIYSGEGEVVCGLKDGVEYVLRFGNATGEGSKDEAKPDDKDKKDPAKKDDAAGVKLNRYLFVMAQLNNDLIPKPELEPLPGDEKPEAEKPADDAAKADSDHKDDAKAKKPDAAAPAKGKADKPKSGKPSAKPPQSKGKTDQSKAEKPGIMKLVSDTAKPDKSEASEEKASADKAPAEKADDAKSGETKAKDARAKTSDDEEAAEAEKARALAAKREAVEKQNQRKQKDYDEQVKKAEERVAELNDRFADWYYVISDDVYRKIHLGGADIAKKKESPAAHDDHDHEHGDADHADGLPDLKGFGKPPKK